MNETLIAYNLEHTDSDEFRPSVGPPLLRSLELFLESRGADPARAPDIVERYRSEDESVAFEMAATYAGVPELLAELHSQVWLAATHSTSKLRRQP